jgi:hypothetical protein
MRLCSFLLNCGADADRVINSASRGQVLLLEMA